MPSRKQLYTGEIRPPTDNPKLFDLFVSKHIVNCLESGGDVSLLFGNEVRDTFAMSILRADIIRVYKPVKPIKHIGMEIDVQIWAYKGK